MKAPAPFILMADMPANPLDETDLSDYCDLGFNTFIMTEDNHIALIEDGRLGADYKASLDRLSLHGLDVFIRNMYNDPDYFINEVEDKPGSNYGTPYLLGRRRLTSEFSAYPQIKGFYMADEPFMEAPKGKELYTDFSKIGKLAAWKNRYYPSLYFHVNHVPSSSYDHFDVAHGVTYRDFLQAYIDRILLKLSGGRRSLCLDHYPFAHDGEITKDYLDDLLVGSTLVSEHNRQRPDSPIDFGLCIQTFRYLSPIGEGLQRDIASPEEITFQLFVGLALGAQVYEYFCYRSSEIFNCFGMIRGEDRRVYELAKKANATFVPYLEYLKDYRFSASAVLDGPSSFNLKEKGAALEVSEGRLLLGVYEKDGRRAYLLCPFGDPMKHGSVSLSVKGGVHFQAYSSRLGLTHLSDSPLKISCGEAIILFA